LVAQRALHSLPVETHLLGVILIIPCALGNGIRPKSVL
jgi:hypothetical protein